MTSAWLLRHNTPYTLSIMDDHSSNPIHNIIIEILESRYQGVTFSEEIISSIEDKVAPAIRLQTEETVTEFITDFFNPNKKPIRKPRKKAAKKAANVAPEANKPAEPAKVESTTSTPDPASPSMKPEPSGPETSSPTTTSSEEVAPTSPEVKPEPTAPVSSNTTIEPKEPTPPML